MYGRKMHRMIPAPRARSQRSQKQSHEEVIDAQGTGAIRIRSNYTLMGLRGDAI